MKDLLTLCKCLAITGVLALLLTGQQAFAATGAAQLQEETARLLRQSLRQQQDVIELQQQLRNRPVDWPLWWGVLGGVAALGVVALGLRLRPVKPAADALDPDSDFVHLTVAETVVGQPFQPRAAQPAVVQPAAPVAEDEPLPAAARPAVPLPLPDLTTRADALLAMLGEVEFLVSLGLEQGGMQILEQHLAQVASPAPLAWLELVDMQQRLGAVDPATATWHRFLHEVPAAQGAPVDIDTLFDPHAGLEAFPAPLDRVAAAWGTAGTAEQLAAEVMAARVGEPLLSLRAARDLVWLLQVCREADTQASACPAAEPSLLSATAFDRTEVLIAPAWTHRLDDLDLSLYNSPAAVDIDLSAPSARAQAGIRASKSPSESGAAPAPTPARTPVGAPRTSPAQALDTGGSVFDLFDAATGFERSRAGARSDPAYR